jgi:hypothetical protein
MEFCPVSFTTSSLFTEKVRRDSGTWRVLGCVPDLNRQQLSAMNLFDQQAKAERPMRKLAEMTN